MFYFTCDRSLSRESGAANAQTRHRPCVITQPESQYSSTVKLGRPNIKLSRAILTSDLISYFLRLELFNASKIAIKLKYLKLRLMFTFNEISA